MGSDVKVMTTSIYSVGDLVALKETVQQYVDYSRSYLPEFFPKVINFIQEEGANRRYYMTLDELVKYFKRDYRQNTPFRTRAFKEIKQRFHVEDPSDYKNMVETCLEYYHRKGWIL